MKSSIPSIVVILAALASSVSAQGPLTPPPGPPVAGMKTLDQIEPRKPLVTGTEGVTINPSGLIAISQPGSYFLTGNITITTGVSGIYVNSSDVTLDLGGFTIASTGSSGGDGITLANNGSRIFIHNGNIRSGRTYSGGAFSGNGFSNGIRYAISPNLGSVRVKDVNVEGVIDTGIDLGTESGIVESCVVRVAGTTGISAGLVTDSTALVIGTTPISATSVVASIGKKADGTYTSLEHSDTRIPIPGGASSFTIVSPGSYLLAGNLTVASGDGIVIAADDVTLDLNGFTISSTSATASGDAISLSGARNRIAISNGHIRSGVTYNGSAFTTGPGFESGINWPASQPGSVRVSGISVSGVKSFGIDIGSNNSSIVQACTIRVAGGTGIRAGIVSDSSVTLGGYTTISASRAANCIGARADGSGTGVVTSDTSIESVATTLGATQTAVIGVQSTATATQTAVGNVQTTTNSLFAAADKRVPITSLPIIISTPGSYYLAGNLGVFSGTAITIAANNVTIDLNGFTISSVSGSSSDSAITSSSSAIRGITIKNGGINGNLTLSGDTISGSAFGYGIRLPDNELSVVENVRGYGTLVDGIMLHTTSSVAKTCATVISGGTGIRAGVVMDCSATKAVNRGIESETVSNSYGSCVASSGFGFGISGSTINGSKGVAVAGVGVYGKIVNNSYGVSSTNYALQFAFTASGCYGTSSSSSGIYGGLGTATNCIGFSANGTYGLQSYIAVGCRGQTATVYNEALSYLVNYKYNMP